MYQNELHFENTIDIKVYPITRCYRASNNDLPCSQQCMLRKKKNQLHQK